MILRQRHTHRKWLLIQLIEDGLQLILEPGMQYGIGCREHSPGSHLTGCRAKEREQFGRAPTNVLVWLHGRLALLVPVCSRLGNGLIRSGLIFTQVQDPGRFRLLVGLLEQAFFSPALGSCTVTVPAVRTRTAVPVGHQVRVLPKR
jgi:hypothetical protein